MDMSIVDYISQSHPETKRALLAEAEQFLQGMHVLPGTGGRAVFVGNPPNWFENPYRDNEYVWVLNRMGHWPVLLQAYRLTGDGRFARKVVEELVDWLERCPRPPLTGDISLAQARFDGVDPWRSLEAGVRMAETWPALREHLEGTEFLTPGLIERLERSAQEHAAMLMEIPPLFWPDANHNHYLIEMLGLLGAAAQVPDREEAARFRAFAVREIVRCAENQLTADGAHIEGCPLYHNGCLYLFNLAIVLGRRCGMEFPEQYQERVRAGLDYSLYAFRPSGTGVPLGDSDADLSAVRTAIAGWVAFGDRKWLAGLAGMAEPGAFQEECLRHAWEVHDVGAFAKLVNLGEGNGDGAALPLFSWQREVGQVAMRTDWGRNALSVLFVCRTPLYMGAHSHADPMGFDLTALGRPLLVDPGRYTYRDDQDRRDFKSAAWHNTVLIDDREPFEYRSSWVYGPQKEGKIAWANTTGGFPSAEAVHHNYEPVVHRRLIAILRGRRVLIVDHLDGLAPDSGVFFYWHFDSTAVRWNPAGQAAEADCGETRLLLNASHAFSGQFLPGKISDTFDISRPSLRLCLTDRPRCAAQSYGTLLTPVATRGSVSTPGEIRVATESGKTRVRLRLDGDPCHLLWVHGQGVTMEGP